MSTKLPLASRIIINGQPLSKECNIHRVCNCYDLLVIPTSNSVYLVREQGKAIGTVRYYCNSPIEYTTVSVIKIDNANLSFKAEKVFPSTQSEIMQLDVTDRVIDIYVSERNCHMEVYIALRELNHVYPEKRK